VGELFLKAIGTLMHTEKRGFFLPNQRKSAFIRVKIKFGVNHVFIIHAEPHSLALPTGVDLKHDFRPTAFTHGSNDLPDKSPV
jgi:hypothetical protein